MGETDWKATAEQYQGLIGGYKQQARADRQEITDLKDRQEELEGENAELRVALSALNEAHRLLGEKFKNNSHSQAEAIHHAREIAQEEQEKVERLQDTVGRVKEAVETFGNGAAIDAVHRALGIR